MRFNQNAQDRSGNEATLTFGRMKVAERRELENRIAMWKTDLNARMLRKTVDKNDVAGLVWCLQSAYIGRNTEGALNDVEYCWRVLWDTRDEETRAATPHEFLMPWMDDLTEEVLSEEMVRRYATPCFQLFGTRHWQKLELQKVGWDSSKLSPEVCEALRKADISHPNEESLYEDDPDRVVIPALRDLRKSGGRSGVSRKTSKASHSRVEAAGSKQQAKLATGRVNSRMHSRAPQVVLKPPAKAAHAPRSPQKITFERFDAAGEEVPLTAISPQRRAAALRAAQAAADAVLSEETDEDKDSEDGDAEERLQLEEARARLRVHEENQASNDFYDYEAVDCRFTGVMHLHKSVIRQAGDISVEDAAERQANGQIPEDELYIADLIVAQYPEDAPTKYLVKWRNWELDGQVWQDWEDAKDLSAFAVWEEMHPPPQGAGQPPQPAVRLTEAISSKRKRKNKRTNPKRKKT